MPADLTTRIRERLDDDVDIALNPDPYTAAIRAVLDLHRPDQFGASCNCGSSWPCMTVEAIANALDIKEESADA